MSRLDRTAGSETIESGNERERKSTFASLLRRHPLLVSFSALSFLLALAVYILRVDNVVGLFVDDAWYVLLARALGTSQGYQLINSPTPGILPLYPPGFPAILSIVFRIAPEFPANLWMLKSVSIAAMLLSGAVVFHYFARVRLLPGYLALSIALATMVTPPLVFMATSTVMSECVYLLLMMSAIVAGERAVTRAASRTQIIWTIAAGVLSSFAFLTRSFGAVLIVAILVYMIKSKALRNALMFAVVAGVLSLPWVVYSGVHKLSPELRLEQDGSIVQPIPEQFWQRRAGIGLGGTVTTRDLPERVWENAVEISGRDLGRILVAPLFEAMAEAIAEIEGANPYQTLTLSFVLAIFVIAGFIKTVRQRVTLAEIVMVLSIAVTLIWPWETIRSVAPLAPLIIFYFLIGCGLIYHLHLRLRAEAQRPGYPGLAAVACVLVAISLTGHFLYVKKKSATSDGEKPVWTQVFNENKQVLDWLTERASEGTVIATNNPAMAYLYSGKKTVSNAKPAANWDRWNQLGVRYLAYLSPFRIKDPDYSESRYITVLQSRGNLNLRVVDLGPPSQRERWGIVVPRNNIGIGQ